MSQAISLTQMRSPLPPLFFSPLQHISERIKRCAAHFFGYVARLVTFQMGLMKHWGARWIMRAYNLLLEEVKPFDPKRLEDAKNLLSALGGIEVTLHVKERNAEIKAMHFTSKALFKALGGSIVEIDGERYLENPSTEIDLKKLYLEKKVINGKTYIPLPPACKSKGAAPHVIFFQSPGRSMYMNRRIILQHLLSEYNATVCDLEGVLNQGTPSEAAHYLGAEAVLEDTRKRFHLPYGQIYVNGYCHGAAVAAHLKKKFHQEGLHFIGTNPYTSMKEMMENYGFLGRLTAKFGLWAVQDGSTSVQEDGFDNMGKFSSLTSQGGKSIFVDADTDTKAPPNSAKKLYNVAKKYGPCSHFTRICLNPKEDSHMTPAIQDPLVWKHYVETVI